MNVNEVLKGYIRNYRLREPSRASVSSLFSWSSMASDWATCEIILRSYIEYKEWNTIIRTTRRTDFLEDSCISPAMISSSKIWEVWKSCSVRDYGIDKVETYGICFLEIENSERVEVISEITHSDSQNSSYKSSSQTYKRS